MSESEGKVVNGIVHAEDVKTWCERVMVSGHVGVYENGDVHDGGANVNGENANMVLTILSELDHPIPCPVSIEGRIPPTDFLKRSH